MKAYIVLAALVALCFTEAHSQPGTLDPAFGSNGHLLADLSAQNREDEMATKVFVQPDGKRVLVVDRYPYIQLIRLNADGSYDNSYGEGGFSQAVNLRRFGGPFSNAAMQADGKIVVTGETEWNSTTLTDFGVARWNTDGTLDASFGNQGVVTTNFGYWDEGMIVKIQPDGKILVGGTTRINNLTYLAFARYNSNGTPDASFGSLPGTHVNPIFNGVEPVDMELTPDGKIMVLGDDFSSDFVLARFLSTGLIDATFMTFGYHAYDWGGTYPPFMECMAIQADGKILLGGSIFNGVNSDMLIARYNATGAIDNTFHGDGKQTTHIGGSESILDLALQSDGKIVAAGRVFYSSLPTVFALARYLTNGDLDGTFGVQGTQITAFPGYAGAAAVTVVLHADGDITAAGGAVKNYTDDVAVATYDVQGVLNQDGYPVQRVTAYYPDNGLTMFLASAVQTDGKIVAVGRAWNGNDYDFLIARFNTDGTADQGFGTGGYQRTHFAGGGTGDETASALAIQADGKIVVSGQFFNFIVGGALPVVRYNPDGSLDSSFDADGLLLIDYPGIFEEGNAVVIQPDGKILIGGSVLNFSTDFDFSLCRLNPDGSLDGSFGTGGLVTTDFGYQDIIFGLALQPDGKILATGNTSLPNSFNGFDFCTVRYNSNGTLDTGFGTNGRVTTDFDGGVDFAETIALQSNGKIVVGGAAPIGTDFEFALARYNADGTHDATFGTSGKVTTSFSGYDIGTSVSVQVDGKVILAGFKEGSGSVPTPLDVILARYNSNGTLDGSFGSLGKVTSDFGGQEIAFSLSMFNRKLYVAGFKRIFRNFTATDKHFGLVAAYRGDPPPDQQIGNLMGDINALPIPSGTKQSLNAKLQAALNSLAAGDTTGACNNLRAFINEVNAQAGKKRLTAAQAAQLISAATAIMAALPCPFSRPGGEMTETPQAFRLEQNHPNPFNPETRIRYALPEPVRVHLAVYDILGREVRMLVNETQPAGIHEAVWDAKDNAGLGLPSGVYFYRLQAGATHQIRKMMLLK